MEVTDNDGPNMKTPKIEQQLGIASTPSQQQWLAQTAQNTQTIPSSNELFTHYPEGGGVAGFGSSPIKDPLVDFLQSPISSN